MCSCNPTSKWTVRSQGLPGQLIYPKSLAPSSIKHPVSKNTVESNRGRYQLPRVHTPHTHTWYWGAMQPCEVPSAEHCPALLISSPNSSGVGCHQNFLKVRKLKQLSQHCTAGGWGSRDLARRSGHLLGGRFRRICFPDVVREKESCPVPM